MDIKQMAMVKCCPFCGNTESIKIEQVGITEPIVYVNCSPPSGGCGATGPICHNIYQAIAAWNDREWGEK